MSTFLVWSIVAASVAGILFRPKNWPEAVWASLGAVLVVLLRLLPPRAAWVAIGKGAGVYLFLAGMMLLAELARREGVFDWLAGHAVGAAHGSRSRLFLLVYSVGTLVTVFLSNDATAVVLTPAVYAAVSRAKTPALPYLLCCAFIANAASFVLPISNPANLVVYGKQIPPLFPWLKLFLLPSVLSIAATFLVLRYLSRRELQGPVASDAPISHLPPAGRHAAWGIAAAGIVLVTASALGRDLGLPTGAAAIAALCFVTQADWRAALAVARGVTWSVLPLVAGLFVLVEALDHAGALADVAAALRACSALPPLPASLAAAFSVAALANLMNNLPSGLLAGSALATITVPGYLRHAVLLATDLGPNLSVTGSLATVLWLVALRREGLRVSGWSFLKVGCLVMPPALLLATLALLFTAR